MSRSDFRIEHGQALDELLSTSLAALMDAGVVKLKQVAQNGVRVRAGAGAASFRRRDSPQDNLEQACARVHELKQRIEDDPRRTAAAR